MIPKKIHWIWLSNEHLNRTARLCIRTWKQSAPDYEIRRWRLRDFDMSAMPDYVHEAIAQKKWAFACDYLRLYLLYHEGGFYLDSDVVMVRAPDRYLLHGFVSAVEHYENLFVNGCKFVDENGNATADVVEGMAIQAAIMGSEPKHPFVRACMDYYQDKHFVYEPDAGHTRMLAPHVYALVGRSFGFKYVDELQVLKNNMVLYPSYLFAPGSKESTTRSEMVHLCNASWRELSFRERWRYNKFMYYSIANKLKAFKRINEK